MRISRSLGTIIAVSALACACKSQNQLSCGTLETVPSPDSTDAPISPKKRDAQVVEFKKAIDAWHPLLKNGSDEKLAPLARAYVKDIERVHALLRDAKYKKSAPLPNSGDPEVMREAARKEAAEFGIDSLALDADAPKLPKAPRREIERAMTGLEKSRAALFGHCASAR